MATAAVVGEDFSIGRVVSRTFGTIGRNAVPFFVLAFLAYIPSFGLELILGGAPRLEAGHTGAYAAAMFATIMLTLVFSAVLQAALVHGTVSDLNGRKASLADCLQTGIKTALPVIGISILEGLGIMLGFIALIVPGILLMLAWAVVVPVRVVEKETVFECFGRSADLTKGHRGAIFVLGLLWWAIIIALSIAILPFKGLGIVDGGIFSSLHTALSAATNIIGSTIGAAGVASIYYELRSITEGVGPEQLASVFD